MLNAPFDLSSTAASVFAIVEIEVIRRIAGTFHFGSSQHCGVNVVFGETQHRNLHARSRAAHKGPVLLSENIPRVLIV